LRRDTIPYRGEKFIRVILLYMENLNSLDWVALVLVIVGAINWGLVGVVDFDLVAQIFGDMSSVSRVVYTLVGLSGLYLAFTASSLKKG